MGPHRLSFLNQRPANWWIRVGIPAAGIFGLHLVGRLVFARDSTPLWFWLVYGAVTVAALGSLVIGFRRSSAAAGQTGPVTPRD